MAYLYSDALGKLLSCYFVLRQRFLYVLKIFGIFQGGFELLSKVQAYG